MEVKLETHFNLLKNHNGQYIMCTRARQIPVQARKLLDGKQSSDNAPEMKGGPEIHRPHTYSGHDCIFANSASSYSECMRIDHTARQEKSQLARCSVVRHCIEKSCIHIPWTCRQDSETHSFHTLTAECAMRAKSKHEVEWLPLTH